jgi:hypothetical protein
MTGSADGPSAPGTREALDGLARPLLAEENTQSVVQRVVDLARQVVPARAEVSITVVRDERATTAAFSGELALHLDETQYGQGYGPCLEAALGGQLIEVTDGRTESRWPEYMPIFLEFGALSSLAVPVPAAQSAAGLNVFAPVAAAFTDEHRQAVAQLAAYAAVASATAANLRAAMESRAAIEQAKGILIERFKVTPDQAFRLLTAVSMNTNRKVRDLAEQLVLTGELTHESGTA